MKVGFGLFEFPFDKNSFLQLNNWGYIMREQIGKIIKESESRIICFGKQATFLRNISKHIAMKWFTKDFRL